ncbi:MAG: hypothetical protein IPL61_36205 [Myxococcales bacterium]|nr:hypothetical protein [Myxococcales bacterium]
MSALVPTPWLAAVLTVATTAATATARPATCPAPASAPVVPPEVPEPGCPTVTLGACTAHCMPSMTHLVFAYDGGAVVTIARLMAMTAQVARAGWTVTGRHSSYALIVQARRGHDALSFVLALDRRPRIEITFAPG